MSETQKDGSWVFRLLVENYAFYFRCEPRQGDYDLYVYAYVRDDLSNSLAQARGLPLMCFSVLASTGEPIAIRFGENGYYPEKLPVSEKEKVKRFVEAMNRDIDVTPAEAAAMECGSMFGWSCPGADPKSYDVNGKPLKIKTDREER